MRLTLRSRQSPPPTLPMISLRLTDLLPKMVSTRNDPLSPLTCKRELLEDHLVDSDSFFTMTSQSILQELITKLNTREGQIALEKMNNDERAGLQSVITEVMTDKESHTFDIPPHIPRLLSRFGLIIPRGRAGSSDEVSGRSPAPRKVDSVSGMDPVELAKRVAADASTSEQPGFVIETTILPYLQIN